jgi:4-amino-4-deoxy-L-arabinose transferase-like glycosyltransferase
MMKNTSKSQNAIRSNGVLLLLGGAVVLFHILLNGQYGFHRDELDIIMNARRLAWGYVAYPPFTPFVARIGLELFGNSLRGLRLFSALGQGVVVVLAGLMARDLYPASGSRSSTLAEVAAALAVFIAPMALTAGTMIQYMSFDYLWWVLIAFFFVRLLKTEDPRYWVGIGVAIGLGMMTKYTVLFFVAGLGVAVLLTPNRRYLRSPWLWAGAGLALLIFLPNLVWQIQHDFISLDFLSAIHARDILWGRTSGFLPEQLYVSVNPLTLPLWITGLALCLFAPGFKRFRAIGITFLVTFGLLWVARSRAYYVGPAYVMLLAAGAAGLDAWLAEQGKILRRSIQTLEWALLGMGLAIGVILVKPIAPINSSLWEITSEVNGEVIEMVGWEDLTAQVADIYAKIPEAEKPGTVILAGNYGEAGALDLYGPAYDLPPVISGANSLWQRGYGGFDPETVIVVGFESNYASRFFSKCEAAGQVTNRYGVKNEETTNHTGLYVCRQPRQPWAEMWPAMQWFQ